MSNSISQLLALQKMAQAQKSQTPESSAAATAPRPEPPATAVVPAVKESESRLTPAGNGLGALMALSAKTTGLKTETPDIPAPPAGVSEPAQALAESPTTEPVPATSYPAKEILADIAEGIGRQVVKTELSIEQIARIDEAGIAAPDLTAGIRADLDRLDALLVRDTGINAFNIDDCRGLIMRIMPELKKNPMYVGLVVDRDVHNIMTFCMATQQVAIIENTVKKSKEVKAKGKAGVKAAMAAALGNMTIPGIDDLSL